MATGAIHNAGRIVNIVGFTQNDRQFRRAIPNIIHNAINSGGLLGEDCV